MTNKEYDQMQEYFNEIRRSNQTILKVPYRDTISGFSHMSKEVILKGYTNSIGKMIRYVELEWKVVDVTVVGEEIRVILCR